MCEIAKSHIEGTLRIFANVQRCKSVCLLKHVNLQICSPAQFLNDILHAELHICGYLCRVATLPIGRVTSSIYSNSA